MKTEKLKEFNPFLKIAAFVLVISSIFIGLDKLVIYNDYKTKIEDIEIKKAECVENIERLQYELSRDFNNEYVAEIARDKLNLCLPNETVYFTGLN